MPHTIVMPALSAGMEEGTIGRWLKVVGDTIARGEAIVEVETDKATTEYEAETAGVLSRIVAAEGAIVRVNGAIAELVMEGERLEEFNAARSRDIASSGRQPAHRPPVNKRPAPPQKESTANGRRRASPLARRFAGAKGIELEALQGSGPGGRIVRLDVEDAVASRAAIAEKAVEATRAPDDIEVFTAGTRIARVAPVSRPVGPFDEVPLSAMRKIIARRLTEAKATIPHFYLEAECELDSLLELRTRLNFDGANAYKLSINDFVIKAAALALRQVPEVNVSWTDDAILMLQDVDISVAVATESGLITPIICHADRKGLSAISSEARALAARAREGRLQPSEYQGGGLTISNLGMYGVRSFSAIINPPQSCILAIGAGERRPVVRGDSCVPATVMSCTLSVDHRSVDGAVGARYLAAFKSLIEQPLLMML